MRLFIGLRFQVSIASRPGKQMLRRACAWVFWKWLRKPACLKADVYKIDLMLVNSWPNWNRFNGPDVILVRGAGSIFEELLDCFEI
jgi:hypothetical protein